MIFHTDGLAPAVLQHHIHVAEHGFGFAAVGFFGHGAFDLGNQSQQCGIVQVRIIEVLDVDDAIHERNAGGIRHAVVGGFAVGRRPFVGVTRHHLNRGMQRANMDFSDIIDVGVVFEADSVAGFQRRVHHGLRILAQRITLDQAIHDPERGLAFAAEGGEFERFPGHGDKIAAAAFEYR